MEANPRARDNMNTCPPCNGECRQGRDCPAIKDGDPPMITGDKAALILMALLVIAFWGCVIMAIRSAL